MTFLAASAAKATVILAAAWLLALLLRRASAALRHQVWTASIFGSLLLPIFAWALPTWRVPVITTVTPIWTRPAPAEVAFRGTKVPFVIPRSDRRTVLAAAAPVKLRTRWTASDTLLLIWAAGFAIAVLRFGAGLAHLRMLRRKLRPIVVGLTIPQRVRLFESANPAAMPLTWGLFRPHILLPSGAAAWPAQRLRMVLAHELAHVSRCDWAAQMMAELARAVYWFHPLAWVALAALRQESERACDDTVINAGVSAADYADQLVHLARTLENPGPAWSAALAVARITNFERRLNAMLTISTNRRPASPRTKLITALASLSALIPLAALAPGQEIRGTVIEPGTNHGIADVQITIYQQGTAELGQVVPQPKEVAKITTDAQGAFRFQPDGFGTFQVTVKKDGYTYPSGSIFRPSPSISPMATLDKDHPSREVHFSLVRPGELSGRVMDEDTGAPLANFPLRVLQFVYINGLPQTIPAGASATTNDDGRFLASNLRPGSYLVQIQPSVQVRDRLVPQFSEADWKAVHQDYPLSYWPGGGAMDLAVPVQVVSGGSVDAGTIRLRKTAFYSVHARIALDNCETGEKVEVLEYIINTMGGFQAGSFGELHCGDEFLLRDYQPGSYGLFAIAGKAAAHTQALVPIEIKDKPLDVTITLNRGFDLEGHLVTAEGAGKISLDAIKIMMRAVKSMQLGNDDGPVTADAQGKFRFPGLQFSKKELSISGLSGNTYIKEVRYNGIPADANIFDFTGQGFLEIILDDHPASISGAVSDRDKPVSSPNVVLVRWPPYADDIFKSVQQATGDDDGRFQFTRLPPGEYRIFAIPQASKDQLDEPHVLERLLSRAEKVTLERGGSQNLPLRLTDPSR